MVVKKKQFQAINIPTFSVLIPDGESPYALNVSRCLGQVKGISIYILSNNYWEPVRLSKHVVNYFTFPASEGNQGRYNAAIELIKKMKIDVVLPIDEPSIRYFSANSQSIKALTSMVSLPEIGSFDIAINKWLLANWLEQKHFPTPTTILQKSGSEFVENLSNICFPALIKPLGGVGGRGIILFNAASDLLNYFNNYEGKDQFIVQSYIKGYDIDCSVLCEQGQILNYTIQQNALSDTLNFSHPGSIDFHEKDRVFQLVKRIIAELNWSGVVHFDLRYNEDNGQPYVIETNARYWGSLLGSLHAGINFPYLACLKALNQALPQISFRPIRYIRSKTSFKMLKHFLVNGKNESSRVYKSDASIIARDPLPTLFSMVNSIYNKLKIKKKVQVKLVGRNL